MKRKIIIREQSWLAKKAAQKLGCNSVAIVFRRTIHLHNTTAKQFFSRPSWVIHELKHVEQYERLGTLVFLLSYLVEHLRKGYWDNAFEAEARAAESDRELLSRYDLSAYSHYLPAGY